MYTKTKLTWIDEKISKGDAVNEKTLVMDYLKPHQMKHSKIRYK